MKLLKVYNRDGTEVENISEFTYLGVSEGKVNEVQIFKNPKYLLDKVIEIWDFWKPIFSWLLRHYSWSDNDKKASIYIYPLIIDLMDDFIRDTTINSEIFYYTGQIEDVFEEIMDQYLASTVITDHVLKKGTFATTSRYVEFTFNYASLYDSLRFLQEKMLTKGFYIQVDIDGTVNLLNYTNVVDLKNHVDIESIEFEERIDENIKTIIFDNKSTDNRIFKTYTNPDPLVTRWKVKYLWDARFKEETSADNYVQAYFEENWSPKIEVNEIISKVDVPLYTKVNIYNWDKNFSDIYVVWKEYLPDNTYNLKLGTDSEFKVLGTDEIASVQEEIQIAVSEIDLPQVPEYIKETFIDSVEIKSPTISGNDGNFSGVVKVWVNGIILDGIQKEIRSDNFNSWSAGYRLEDDGSAELNDVVIRWDIEAGTININNEFQVDAMGDVVANAIQNETIQFEKLGNNPSFYDGKMWCEWNPTNKVLWGYFGGQYQKQQVSMSRMQFASAFDRTSSQTIPVNTWFQPRMIVFNGFFENTSQEKYGTTNGQAGSVSSTLGFCNASQITFDDIEYIDDLSVSTQANVVRDLDVDFLGSSTKFHTNEGGSFSTPATHYRTGIIDTINWWNQTMVKSLSWTNRTRQVMTQIDTANITDALASNSVSKNCYAYVSNWTDTGVTIEVVVGSGWRLAWNFIIIG